MDGGAYTAERAAALSGVPKSTVHWWARGGIVVPSVSPERTKLWSYADLLALRTVYWLRQRKVRGPGHEIPRTSLPEIRRALRELQRLDLDLFEQGRPTVFVQPDGHIVLEEPEGYRRADGQTFLPGYLDLIAPFTTDEATRGVDLREPAPLVRIAPRRLAGAPHVVHTRIATESLAALRRRGFDVAGMRALYPDLSVEAIESALGVEDRLAENLAA